MPGCPNHNGVSPILMEICTTLPPHITSMEKYKLDPQVEITAMTGVKRENPLIEKHGNFHHLHHLLAVHRLLKLVDGKFHHLGNKQRTGYSYWVMEFPSSRLSAAHRLLKLSDEHHHGDAKQESNHLHDALFEGRTLKELRNHRYSRNVDEPTCSEREDKL